MVWVVLVVALAGLLLLSERRRRRDWEDLTRPGMGARGPRPGSGTGHLGEAPVTVHHRLGGRGRND
ncbi:hypothetical protein [Nocardioides zhouii]|uniref:Uncharacterized protein n=1 Tax=Nocardioides zhouii TaxID=1168729 RepID=A0A4Q2T5N2_9ACTN|nr:hypothetical protein [Nocardioides zhouii]RYC13353.1 hypothetical protein EUA94_05640 [Nocardioides zhouii]